MSLPEFFGLLGGVIFLFSWILQAWETRRKGYPIVSLNFFILRFVGSTLLLIESIRVGSLGLIIVISGTMILIVYNIYLHICPR